MFSIVRHGALALSLVAACVCGCGSSTSEEGTGGAGAGSGGTTTTTSHSGSGGGAGATGGSGAGGAGAFGGSGGAGGTCAPIPAPVPDVCITDVSAADAHSFLCEGLRYDVSVPAACTSCACGLIFDVHGFTMNGLMQEHNTGLAALGRANGYIVVQPNASGVVPSWNAALDDVRVFAFLERVRDVFHADPKRLHFTGFSQGGSMTWRMACDHADVLASVAPAAYNDAEAGCFSLGAAPPHERPILYMHGTSDALVAFATALDTRDDVIAAQAMSAAGVVESDGAHTWTRYTNASGNVFEFIEHDYAGVAVLGGHCYPGSNDAGGVPGQLFSFACAPPNAFTWGAAVMQFFLSHPLP